MCPSVFAASFADGFVRAVAGASETAIPGFVTGSIDGITGTVRPGDVGGVVRLAVEPVGIVAISIPDIFAEVIVNVSVADVKLVDVDSTVV